MKQTELDKLLAAPYAEFDRRLRDARFRAAGLEGADWFVAAPAQAATAAQDARPLRVEEVAAVAAFVSYA